MNSLLKTSALVLALGLAGTPALAADDATPRDVYESRMTEMLEAQEATNQERDLSDDAAAAWDKVKESWQAVADATDETWQDAKTSMAESWSEFQAEWEKMTAGDS